MYEITIREKKETRKVIPKKWAIVGQTQDAKSGQLADQYDYTPETETIVTEDREVLKQVVEDLDLAAVIKAINKI